MIRMAFYVVFWLSFVTCSVNAAELKIISSAAVGGGYSSYSLLLARHIGKHLPETSSVIVQHMPGAGGVIAANYLYNVVPKNGTVIGGIHRAILQANLLGVGNVAFRADEFIWIGSMASAIEVCLFSKKSGITTIEDIKKREVFVGSSGPNNTQQYPIILNTILNTKLKIITGYQSTYSDISLAIERGELDGICGVSIDTNPDSWIHQNSTAVVQFFTRRHPDLPTVPLVSDLTRNDNHKKVLDFLFSREEAAYPYLVPPGVPLRRVDELVLAFGNTMKDREFLSDAKKQKIQISPATAAEVTALVSRLYETPKHVIDSVIEIVKLQ